MFTTARKQTLPVRAAQFLRVFTGDGSRGELDFRVFGRAVGVMIIWAEAGMIFHLSAQLYNLPCAYDSCYGIY